MPKATKARKTPIKIKDDAGNVIAVQKKTKFQERKELNALKKRKKIKTVTEYVFSDTLGDTIVQRVREGLTIHAMCKQYKDIPRESIIRGWMRRNEKFREAIGEAIEDQADHFKEKVIQVADDLKPKGKSDVKVAKVRMEAYKYGAEKGNPKKYGKTESAAGPASVTIILDTGVDSRAIDVPSQVIEKDPKKLDNDDEAQ